MIITIRNQATTLERSQLLTILLQTQAGTQNISIINIFGQEVIPLNVDTLDQKLKLLLEAQSAVENIIESKTPYKFVSRQFQSEDSLITVGNSNNCNQVIIGKVNSPVVIAGPCAVESKQQLVTTAIEVQKIGATMLRGGAFKPRTSPYQFQGLGIEGLKLLKTARDKTGLPIVTEVMESGMVEIVAEYADMLQIGSRNMQNYPLLQAVGKQIRPVLLKRGLSSTIDEWLLAAEYIVAAGNPNVVLCERGIRSFDPQTRNVLDLTAIPLVHQLTHLPIIADPSHGTGRSDLVPIMARASIAAGANGLILEVHPEPNNALCDGKQSLNFDQLRTVIHETQLLTTMFQTVE